MPEDEKSIEQSAFTQRDLPEWVKSLGLPPAANNAIDRYWKPAWDAIKDTLPLLPIHAGRLTIDTAAGEECRPRESALSPSRSARQASAGKPAFRKCGRHTGPGTYAMGTTPARTWRRAASDCISTCPSSSRPTSGWSSWLEATRSPRAVYRSTDPRRSSSVAHRPCGLAGSRCWYVLRLSGRAARGHRHQNGLGRPTDHRDERLPMGIAGRHERSGARGLPDVRWSARGGRRVRNPAGRALPPRNVPDRATSPREASTASDPRSPEPLPPRQHRRASNGHLAPDRTARFASTPATTNHQGSIDWPEYARAVRTVEREQHLLALLADDQITPARFTDAFLDPPLYNNGYQSGMGTLYTAAYFPTVRRVEYRWPGHTMPQSFDRFHEVQHIQAFSDHPQAA